MFSALRIIIIVGVIFYLSPARQTGAAPVSLDDVTRWVSGRSDQGGTVLDQAARAGALWRSLPEDAKQALVEQVLASGRQAPPASPPTDTLDPSDLQPAWKGDGKKPSKP